MKCRKYILTVCIFNEKMFAFIVFFQIPLTYLTFVVAVFCFISFLFFFCHSVSSFTDLVVYIFLFLTESHRQASVVVGISNIILTNFNAKVTRQVSEPRLLHKW